MRCSNCSFCLCTLLNLVMSIALVTLMIFSLKNVRTTKFVLNQIIPILQICHHVISLCSEKNVYLKINFYAFSVKKLNR